MSKYIKLKKDKVKSEIIDFSFAKPSSLAFLSLFCLILLNSCNKTDSQTLETEAKEEHSENSVELSPVQVKTAQIVFGGFEMKNLSEVINVNGYTKLPPQNQADVSVFMSGIVKSISVIEGQYVRKGQSLASFQSVEFNNLRLEKAKLSQELQQTNGQIGYLELEFARQKELSEENIASKKAFQKISSDLDLAKNKIGNIQSQIKIIQQNIGLGGNEANNNLGILAPISGFITAVNIKIGSSLKPETVLFSIVDNSQMHVDLLVYEKDLYKVKVGQKARFMLTNQSNKEIIGSIFSIGKAFQNESKAVAVHADINNTNAGLISGMYVSGLIDVGNNNVNTLPIDAIAKEEGKEYIFIQEIENKADEKSKEDDNGVHFQRIEVKTGTIALGFVQVSPVQNIPAGAKIVTKGAYYLQSAMSNSEGGEH